MGGYDDNTGNVFNDVWSTPDRTISHYKLCWDTVQDSCRNTAVSTPASYTLNQPLSPGTWYFSVTAVNGENEESVLSDSITLIVPVGTSLPSSENGQSENPGDGAVAVTSSTTPDSATNLDTNPEIADKASNEKSSTDEQNGSTLPFVLAITAVIIVTGWLVYRYVIKLRSKL
jgi:hypothetical protein